MKRPNHIKMPSSTSYSTKMPDKESCSMIAVCQILSSKW